ncbi:MAG: extracellular substrate binding-like orphan protein GrrP, partial [Cyanobacteria bacterium J06576_12]
MPSKFCIAASSIAISTLSLMLSPASAVAETVVEKVARTGILTAGVRFDAVPYSYIDDQGELVGYSIDLLRLVEAQLEAELGKEITVQMIDANTEPERIPLLTSGEVDIACDARFTWARDRSVDFSISYSLSGTRLLTRAGSDVGEIEEMAGRNIAVFENSVSKDIISQVQPAANLLTVSSVDAAFAALDEERVEAIAEDTVVLGGWAAQRGGDERYQLALEQPLDRYGVACMMPTGNSTFRYMVDYAIAGLAQGYLDGDDRSTAIVNRWFGESGVVPLPVESLQDFFSRVLFQRSIVPPVAAEDES